MRRSANMDGTEAASAGTRSGALAGDNSVRPDLCFAAAQRYLQLLGNGDVPHLFQPYYDPDPKNPETAWMARTIRGRLAEVWPKLVALQEKDAAIAVTMAETDGRGRKSVNMIRPRAVWIEADSALQRELPLAPSIVVETSPGKHHYIYVCGDLSWEVWHSAQQKLIAEYGSDPRAALRTQVLRLPGTLHLKDRLNPHLVRIVEELTAECVYTAAAIAAAFPPQPLVRHRRNRRGSAPAQAAEWDPERMASAFRAIDARLKEGGPFAAQGDRPGDQAIEVDWSRRDWWLRAVTAIHHASGGSDAGFELSCQVSGGDASKGLIGCPSKFDRLDQERVWETLSNDGLSQLGAAPVTIRTIYWIAQRYAGWKASRPGRPVGQPRENLEITPQARAVADAGRRVASIGLKQVRELHAALCAQAFQSDTLMGRVASAIRDRLNPRTGVAAISSLRGMATTLRCKPETLRRYLRQLAKKGLIIKNEGNAVSMLGTSGLTIALALPQSIWDSIDPQSKTRTPDPLIFGESGITTPHFQAQAGWNASRSSTSHGAAGAVGGMTEQPLPAGPAVDCQAAALWGKADLTLGDWMEAGVLHDEIGDHLELLADKRGKGGVSRVLVRLNDLRTLRKSFAEVRSDVERAADLAARSLARKAGKETGATDTDIAHMVKQATPAGVDREDAGAFVRQMARHLDAITRQAQGDPDPWRTKHWRQQQQSSRTVETSGNAYAEARHKRDAAVFNRAIKGGDDDPQA